MRVHGRGRADGDSRVKHADSVVLEQDLMVLGSSGDRIQLVGPFPLTCGCLLQLGHLVREASTTVSIQVTLAPSLHEGPLGASTVAGARRLVQSPTVTTIWNAARGGLRRLSALRR
jgi:hypothetical protein